MRHPFWKWAGWLGVSLAGCLHGQDGRRVLTHPIADRQESLRPATAGPRQLKREPTKSSPTLTWDPIVGTGPANKQHQAARDPRLVSRVNPARPTDAQIIPTKYVSPSAPTSESVPTPTKPTPLPEPAKFVPAPTTSGTPLTRAVRSRETRPFAEFERAVPLRSTRNAESSATATDARCPAADEVESLSSPSDEKHRASCQTKEFSDVANSATTIRAAESTARTRDVAQLVEQVFEDLRQHRLTEARERTEQLRRLVARSSTVTQMDVTTDDPAQTANAVVDQPAETQLPENRNESPVDVRNETAKSTDNRDNETFFDVEVPTRE